MNKKEEIADKIKVLVNELRDMEADEKEDTKKAMLSELIKARFWRIDNIIYKFIATEQAGYITVVKTIVRSSAWTYGVEVQKVKIRTDLINEYIDFKPMTGYEYDTALRDIANSIENQKFA